MNLVKVHFQFFILRIKLIFGIESENSNVKQKTTNKLFLVNYFFIKVLFPRFILIFHADFADLSRFNINYPCKSA
jgi:hypothetical protein